MANKERLDVLLTQKGYFPTREKAKRAIMAGLVFSQSDKLDKPGLKIPLDLQLTVKSQGQAYVSRGGFKLEKAMQVFPLTVQDQVVLDIGASTGGFTDCALQNGARLVYAVDVGYGQLDWKLRSDARVIVMERTNFRYVKADQFPELPTVATIDVSFISLRIILEALYPVMANTGHCLALVKPQFEAGKEHVGKKGIIRDPNQHLRVLNNVAEMALTLGFDIKGLDYSPITGGDGNIEFLLFLHKPQEQKRSTDYNSADHLNNVKERINSTVQQAHQQFQ